MGTNNIKQEAKVFVEEWLNTIFTGTEISKDENLIEKGLSSIKVMQISGKLKKIGLKISFAKLMEAPDKASWFTLIDKAKEEGAKALEKTRIQDEKGDFPLTDVQYAYLIGREDDQILGGVGCHAYIEIDGENIDSERLNSAWNQLQYRHPMLRAKFTKDGRQEILNKPYKDKIEIIDLVKTDPDSMLARLVKIRDKISHRKLNVTQGEVAGLTLAKLPDRKTRIFLDVDLLVADVMSISIIVKELAQLYSGERLDKMSSCTFKNYIENVTEHANNLDDKAFWEDKINSFEIERPSLPLRKQPEQIETTKFTRRKKIIKKDEWKIIKQIAATYKNTPSMVLLTAYALVIERWCNQENFFINIPLFNRDLENEALKNMVADFTNLLLVEHKSSGNSTFLETLKKINKTFLNNVAHRSYSGVQVQRDISKSQGTSINVAPVVFACNIDYPLETEVSRNTLGEINYMISQTPGVWLDFQSYIKDGNLILCWDSVDELFPEGLLEDMLDSLYELLLDLTDKNCWEKPIDVLPKNQKEKRKKDVENILPFQYPDETLYDGFLRNAIQTPDRIAVIDSFTKVEVTYGEILEKSLKIADFLVKNGVEKGNYIGITLPRGSRQIYAIFGILFAGVAYVSIGISQPKDRRCKIYDQIGIEYIISDDETVKTCNLGANEEVKIINLDMAMASESRLERPVKISPYDSGYIIMTSGTTGVPKGVEIMHTSAINTCIDLNEKYKISGEDTVLMVSAIDFDLSVYDIFGIFRAGGTVVTTNEENYRNPDEWITLADEFKVTIWDSVPILFDMIVTMAEGQNRKLPFRVAMLSGDWIPINLPERFYKISQEESVVVAMGGATEASIWSNYLNVPRKIPENWISIPYGGPLKNQVYRVVDEYGRICPNYVKGELLIGGVGVAKCYHGDEELTKRKYFQEDGIRWYKTGDNGRIWADGTIEFLGRKDNQVKIKGHRIELGEIENILKEMSSNSNVKVIADTKRNSLYGFIVNPNFDMDKFYSELDNKIIGYMRPDKIIEIDRFPLNKNQKIDINKLILMARENGKELEKTSEKNLIKVDTKNMNKMLEIFKRYIVNSEFNVDSNYFEYGGDSLSAVKIIFDLKNEMRISLKISDIFNSMTVRNICKNIDNEKIDVKKDRSIQKDGYELTNLQKSYWLSFMKTNKVPYFYIEVEVENHQINHINKSIVELLKKKKILKYKIDDGGTKFVESIDFVQEFCIKEYKILDSNDIGIIEEARERIITQDGRKLDPISVSLTVYDATKSIVHLLFNSIYFDATSIMLILSELNNSVNTMNNKEFSEKTDYDRKPLIKYTYNEINYAKKYWKEKRVFNPPNVWKKQNIDPRVERYEFGIDHELEEKLRKISKREGITVSNLILSAFAKAMFIWSNQREFSLNIVLTNSKAEIYEAFGNIGDYTENVLFNVKYNKHDNLCENAKLIQKELSEDMSHMAYGGVDVLRMLRKNVNGRFVSPIVYTCTINESISLDTSNLGKIRYIKSYTPDVYLDCQVSRINNSIIVSWDFRADKFVISELKRYFEIFKNNILDIAFDKKIDDFKAFEEGVI